MNEEQAKNMSKYAFDLFPDLKPQQGKLLVELFIPCDIITVQTTLKNHRINHEFFSFPQFTEGLRVEQRKSNERVSNRVSERIVDFVRRMARAQGDVTYEREKDYIVLVAHFSQAWAFVRDGKHTEFVKNSMRRMILGHARIGFNEIGLAPSEVEMNARDVVELNADESIPQPRSPKGLKQLITAAPALPIAPPAKPIQALKQLVGAAVAAGEFDPLTQAQKVTEEKVGAA